MSSFSWPPQGGGTGNLTYPTFGDFPSATSYEGQLATAQDTGIVYESVSGVWVPVAAPDAPFAIGPFGATGPNPDGLSLQNNEISLEPADSGNPGAVSVDPQEFAGEKTFVDGILTNTIDAPDVSTLAIGSLNADVINIGNSGATINIQGTTHYENVDQLVVSDPLITLNAGGGAGSGSDSGIEIEENAVITGYAQTSSDRNSWTLKAPATAGIATITPGASGITLDQSSHNPVTLGTANGLSLSTQQLSLALASTSTTGALSSTDWNTFNSKAPAGSYITSLTGDVTASGPGAAASTIANAVVTYAKIQDVTQARLLGRYTASTGSTQEISLGAGLTLNAGTGVLDTAGGAGANQALSNLTSPTAINQDFIFNKSSPLIATPDQPGVDPSEGLLLTTGATVDGAAGTLNLIGGSSTNSTGGQITAIGGSSTLGGGGPIVLTAGDSADGSAGGITATAGSTSGIGAPGDINLIGGASSNANDGGSIFATGGSSASGQRGSFQLQQGTKLVLNGSSSGAVTVQAQAAAGTYNFNLPTTAGTAGQPLLSGGGSGTAQTYGTLGLAAGGTNKNLTPAAGGIVYTDADSMEVTAAGTAGQVIISAGSSAPAWGTDVLGVATNSNAASGYKGEFQTASLASGSATSMTSATGKTIISISLTAGDWDCDGWVGYADAASTTTTMMSASISLTNNALGTEFTRLLYPSGSVLNSAANGSPRMVTPTTRLSLASTTTVYLVGQTNFGVSTMTAFGTINCRRVR